MPKNELAEVYFYNYDNFNVAKLALDQNDFWVALLFNEEAQISSIDFFRKSNDLSIVTDTPYLEFYQFLIDQNKIDCDKYQGFFNRLSTITSFNDLFKFLQDQTLIATLFLKNEDEFYVCQINFMSIDTIAVSAFDYYDFCFKGLLSFKKDDIERISLELKHSHLMEFLEAQEQKQPTS
ncbi:hypothetical protein SAMN05421767_1321 [Granulicatella balaenopterae]|uniref:Uncharacterized protein n=1 Tax=Granulicatella balaenopterae TaxID=137733 RepID=A0A1H9MY92_9LACT|nr:hypothetical protein [Granulicatella balaenopterae]SER28551.1 hypothetical protein SAMN05421767_1321 [Granulicatella balaenopterae]